MNETNFTKLKTGDWGVRVASPSAPAPGDTIQVAKKDGSESTVTIGEVLWSKEEEGVHICSIVKKGPRRRPDDATRQAPQNFSDMETPF